MAWKLWKTEKRQDDTRNWPSGTYESLKQLLDMYLSSDSAPFANWAAPGITFPAEVEALARNGVRGYQLALWFWLFAEKHGSIAAKMARESFCLLADAVQASSGDRIDALLELENRLAHSLEALSAQQCTFRLEGLSVELPTEFFLATGLLRLAPDSPYAGNESAGLQGNDFKLADCFRHATEEGLSIFRPMIDAVDFDAKSLPNWKWSAHPGAAERHLQRRHNNPLFPLHRQLVTAHEVFEARLADAQSLQDIRSALNETSRSFSATTELPLNWQSFLEGYRDHVDRLDERRLVAGGQSTSLAEAIGKLRSDILTTWRASIHKNPHSLATLEQEEAKRAARRTLLYECHWTAQLLGHGSAIPPEEIVPALLSESVPELEKAVAGLQSEPRLHETLAQCRATAHRLVNELRAAGHPLPEIDDKLRILDGAPGKLPD
ncbi:tryptophan leader peptide [Paraburkholderia sp. MMS20-SJTN17]|uniref:Tryptophan leader peptide n=1 Tax=Paraburkholderia translucens TaxID=2886945 RepID=A0ABS8K7Y4_9BURK|nr:tryptophan leader peptide [Paraburkholderia sp. MMS20-SJTN17]MCC8400613.1 tryptophan leader peptide [Paraburkholderia sp. MMS20-SJTN17]